MGFWDVISSTTQAVKRNCPSPTAVVDACKASYHYCSAAVGKIGNSVGVNRIEKLNDHIRDEETRSKIVLVASKFTQNAARYALREGYKLIPGGKVVAEIISQTMNDVKSENHSKQKEEALTTTPGVTGDATRDLVERVEEKQSGSVETECDAGKFADSTVNQTPEERGGRMEDARGGQSPPDVLKILKSSL